MTEYSITRRGKAKVVTDTLCSKKYLWVDNKMLDFDLEQLVKDVEQDISEENEYSVTLSVTVESLGKKCEHNKREWVSGIEAAAQTNSVTAGKIYDPAPEVVF